MPFFFHEEKELAAKSNLSPMLIKFHIRINVALTLGRLRSVTLFPFSNSNIQCIKITFLPLEETSFWLSTVLIL